jgi:aminoglycoside phosphotransferase (APT) family kinase protein
MADLPGLNLSRLQHWLDSVKPGLRQGQLVADLIAGGKSNLTYRISDSSQDWALRRPPLGHVLPTAHDMGREFRVIDALDGAGFPVPRPVQFCSDPDVLGAPFYLMSFVPGVVLDTPQALQLLSPREAASASEVLVETLARLHRLEPARIGLSDFGRPDGFMARQVRRWTQQWHASVTRPVPAIEGLIAMLADRVPQPRRATVVHGDYRLTNVLYAAGYDVIAAVVDWEMATLGDPLSDLGLLYTYHELSENTDVIMPILDPLKGFPQPTELLNHYATTAEADLTNIAWYIAFGYFKLAVISEGIAARHLKGDTVGDGFAQFRDLVPHLVEQARAHVSTTVGG